ncbi:hypothetical protein KBD69_05240 [Candidatus Woesebacteria bacterium]|nr:hypothetical protein [Candidatus Woesebacteria bacterium]
MKSCRFCGDEVKHKTDSHIIPRAFFEYSKRVAAIQKDEVMKAFTNAKDQLPVRRSQIGWYDPDLLCPICEQRFSLYDDYAVKVLLQQESSHKPMMLDKKLIGWEVSGYDFEKLKLFFTSVLWRAAASDLAPFSKVQLGAWSDDAKKYISSDGKVCGEVFEYALARFPDVLGRVFLADPHPEMLKDVFGDIEAYRFYLGGGYILYIKSDKKQFPSSLRQISPKAGMPLVIICRGEFTSSEEARVFLDVVRSAGMVLTDMKRKVNS